MRPLARIEAAQVKLSTWVPSLDNEARRVEGTQAVAPTQVSRTKTSFMIPLVSPGTRLVAEDSKATNRPSALMEAPELEWFAWVPSLATETSAVEGTQLGRSEEHTSELQSQSNLVC